MIHLRKVFLFIFFYFNFQEKRRLRNLTTYAIDVKDILSWTNDFDKSHNYINVVETKKKKKYHASNKYQHYFFKLQKISSE